MNKKMMLEATDIVRSVAGNEIVEMTEKELNQYCVTNQYRGN